MPQGACTGMASEYRLATASYASSSRARFVVKLLWVSGMSIAQTRSPSDRTRSPYSTA